MGELPQARERPSEREEGGNRAGEEDGAHQDETDVPAPLHAVVRRDAGERMGQGREPVRTSEPDVHLTFSQGGWLSPTPDVDSSAWEESAGRYVHQHARYDLWPQANISVAARDHRSLGPTKVNERISAAMPWPSLPQEGGTDSQDWEMAWRVWERQQRLDEEQQGNSWNV